MPQFDLYSDIILKAFVLHPKQQEIIDRKVEIVSKISDSYNEDFQKVLFIGFNPAIFALKSRNLYCYQISAQAVSYLHSIKIPIKPLESLKDKFDLIFAADEFFTFVDTEDNQRTLLQNVSSLCSSCIVTTLKDYKNLDFKSREHSDPAIIRKDNDMDVFSEVHSWNMQDRYSFDTNVYHLTNKDATLLGNFKRRTLFFKQLAKITSDCGSNNFIVHKNVMYKSLIKKNYEHVISIDFK